MEGGTVGREVRPFIGPWRATQSPRNRAADATPMTMLALVQSVQNNDEMLHVMFLVSQTERMEGH